MRRFDTARSCRGTHAVQVALPTNRPSSRERIEEILREICVLLVTFAPLDAAFAADLRRAVPTVLIIVAIGIGFIAGSLVSERRR